MFKKIFCIHGEGKTTDSGNCECELRTSRAGHGNDFRGPGARAADEGCVDGEAAPQSPPGPTLYSSAAASEPELVPRLLPSPPNGFQERLCCHGNTCPIILLAENHSSANLAGTYSFLQNKTASCFFTSAMTRSLSEEVEKRVRGFRPQERWSSGQRRQRILERSRPFSKAQAVSPCLQVGAQAGAS